jgi:hypothetical protein
VRLRVIVVDHFGVRIWYKPHLFVQLFPSSQTLLRILAEVVGEWRLEGDGRELTLSAWKLIAKERHCPFDLLLGTVPQFHEQWTTLGRQSGSTDRDNHRNSRSAEIRHPAGLFHCNLTRERRAGSAAKSGRPDVCLHFRDDCRRRGAGQNSYYQFRKSRVDEATYFCGDDSRRINCRQTVCAARIHGADQANTAPWKIGWTNLLNDVRQTFTPPLPKLTGVEVGLVVANPGPSDGEVTMYLGNAAGDVLADVSKTVPGADCGHSVRFSQRRFASFARAGLQHPADRWQRLRMEVCRGRLYEWGCIFQWQTSFAGYPQHLPVSDVRCESPLVQPRDPASDASIN